MELLRVLCRILSTQQPIREVFDVLVRGIQTANSHATDNPNAVLDCGVYCRLGLNSNRRFTSASACLTLTFKPSNSQPTTHTPTNHGRMGTMWTAAHPTCLLLLRTGVLCAIHRIQTIQRHTNLIWHKPPDIIKCIFLSACCVDVSSTFTRFC